jgi:hypothetical protein
MPHKENIMENITQVVEALGVRKQTEFQDACKHQKAEASAMLLLCIGKGIDYYTRLIEAERNRAESREDKRRKEQFNSFLQHNPEVQTDPVSFIEAQLRYGVIENSAMLRSTLDRLKAKTPQQKTA